MRFTELKGSFTDIGKLHGFVMREKILENIRILVRREGYAPLPFKDKNFKLWIDSQEEIIGKNWFWLIDEMNGVAEGAGVEYHEILMLNLRVWQYDLMTETVPAACSSMVITLADGTIANAGALDDDNSHYCGAVKVSPVTGYKFITFPIAGTSWGNRGINSAGLCVGESSQCLRGLKKLPGSICADIALRVILQTCATTAEVKDFCKRHPFTLNLVCSDKNGDVFCAHQTTAGLFEISNMAPYVMTNHIIKDKIRFLLYRNGVEEFDESSCTRFRRGRLLEYAEKNNRICSAKDVRDFIANRMSGDLSSTCPKSNIVLTYANTQAEPGIFWVAEPQITNSGEWRHYTLNEGKEE